MPTPREQSIALGEIAVTIKQQQEARPGASAATLESIVNSELRQLEKESGCSLDDIANFGQNAHRVNRLHPDWAKWVEKLRDRLL